MKQEIDPRAQAALASSASLTSSSIRWARLRARHVEKIVVQSSTTRWRSKGISTRILAEMSAVQISLNREILDYTRKMNRPICEGYIGDARQMTVLHGWGPCAACPLAGRGLGRRGERGRERGRDRETARGRQQAPLALGDPSGGRTSPAGTLR